MRTCSRATTCRASSRTLCGSGEISYVSARLEQDETRRTLEVDEQLGSLEVPTSDTNVVLGVRVVELCQSPINESQLLGDDSQRGTRNDRREKWNAPASSRDQS